MLLRRTEYSSTTRMMEELAWNHHEGQHHRHRHLFILYHSVHTYLCSKISQHGRGTRIALISVFLKAL